MIDSKCIFVNNYTDEKCADLVKHTLLLSKLLDVPIKFNSRVDFRDYEFIMFCELFGIDIMASTDERIVMNKLSFVYKTKLFLVYNENIITIDPQNNTVCEVYNIHSVLSDMEKCNDVDIPFDYDPKDVSSGADITTMNSFSYDPADVQDMFSHSFMQPSDSETYNTRTKKYSTGSGMSIVESSIAYIGEVEMTSYPSTSRTHIRIDNNESFEKARETLKYGYTEYDKMFDTMFPPVLPGQEDISEKETEDISYTEIVEGLGELCGIDQTRAIMLSKYSDPLEKAKAVEAFRKYIIDKKKINAEYPDGVPVQTKRINLDLLKKFKKVVTETGTSIEYINGGEYIEDEILFEEIVDIVQLFKADPDNEIFKNIEAGI